MNNKDLNVLTLAYLGDSIYEIYIRNYLIENNIIKVKELQEKAIKFVSAKAQCDYIHKLLDINFFNETELSIIYRARNHKSHKSKSTDIVTYKYATALEAVIGYLYLEKNYNRIKEIMKTIVGD